MLEEQVEQPGSSGRDAAGCGDALTSCPVRGGRRG